MKDEKWKELTRMELETLTLIHQGYSKALIAIKLQRAPSTISTYIANIYSKLNITGFVLVALYYERNIL